MTTTVFKYPSDGDLLRSLPQEQRIEFRKWIQDLENVLNGAYDKPLHESTGLTCWFAYFEDGYSPADALSEDLSYD